MDRRREKNWLPTDKKMVAGYGKTRLIDDKPRSTMGLLYI